MKNLFKSYTNSYQNLLEKIDDDLVKGKLKPKNFCFNGITLPLDKYSSDIFDLKLEWDELIEGTILSPETNLDKWLFTVREFSDFLRIAEKCYMFTNAEFNSVYSEIDPKTKSSILYININDVKYRLSFQDSVISMPDNKPEFLKNFIEGKDDSLDTVLFIQLDIQREFGKCMKNQFNFILSSEIQFNDDTDIILFINSRKIISKMISECFIDILDNYVRKIVAIRKNGILQFKDRIDLEGVLRNEILLR